MPKQIAIRGPKSLSKRGDYRTELAQYAKEESARLPAGAGAAISIRGKKFSFQGATLAAPLKVVAVDYGFENALYEGDFDPETPQPPVCFAVGKTSDDLAPHEDSPKPQSDSCHDCPHNQFGSADRGKGKACKNSIRVALLSTDTKRFDQAYVKKADCAVIKFPPASIKNFRGYLKKMTEGMQLPLFSVVTALDFDDDPDLAHPVLTLQYDDEISDRATLHALIEKRETAQQLLLQPFDVSNYREAAPRRSKKSAKPKRAKF